MTWYSTSEHGGFAVAASVLATWPAELERIDPFAGRCWYEEDCDWAIVALAMPDLFTERERWQALSTARRWLDVSAFLATERGQAFAEMVDAWEAEQRAMGMYYQSGSYSYRDTTGSGWVQRWLPYGDGPTLETRHTGRVQIPAALPKPVLLEMGAKAAA